jgi:hypothetical protein
LTTDFHEFAAQVGEENRTIAEYGPFFKWDEKARKEHPVPMGPINPQALNRYSYVLNNPLSYIDPTGHDSYDLTEDQLKDLLYELYRIRDFYVTIQIEAAGVALYGALGSLGELPLSGTAAVGGLFVATIDMPIRIQELDRIIRVVNEAIDIADEQGIATFDITHQDFLGITALVSCFGCREEARVVDYMPGSARGFNAMFLFEYLKYKYQ